jgi:two pore calcium channel protein, plant
MEAPLITEAEGEEARVSASGEGGRSGGAGWRSVTRYHRRADALAFGDRYQKAAALVDLVSSRSRCSALALSLTALLRWAGC